MKKIYTFTLHFKVLFMDKEKYIDDLRDIKDIMNRSSRFISLSGMSGVFAGIVALAAAYIAMKTIYSDQAYFDYRHARITLSVIIKIMLLASATVFMAIAGGIYFTVKKAKRNNQKIWDSHVQNMIVNAFIPLATGGILCLMLLWRGYIAFVAPLTLVFYGLALVNASKYTLKDIRSLGLLEIILGLTAFWYIGYGLAFWAMGFGVLHIIYGILMHYKYDR